jgi:hypothetical protein
LTKLHEYDGSRSSDYDLWELFRNDFEGFSVKTFRNGFTLKEQQLLKGYLRRSGVYVKTTNNGQPITQTLVDVLEQEAMEPWNDTEITESGAIRSDLLKAPITSVFLTLNGYDHGRTSVVLSPPAPPAQIAPPLPQVEFQPQPLQ